MTESNLAATLDISREALSISVRDLDIEYRVYEDQSFGVRELVQKGFRSRKSIVVHAVKSVSFDVRIGEAVGIIGSNGSGKSTLLRAVAGLQSRSNGTVLVRGEAYLLGVGAALKPTLSGYRNVMLGGLAIGMTRPEVLAKMDEVTEFSGLGDAMARPMRTYSSGMRARLAFSISTLRVPDVLLIDEALAVGDKSFRERSLARINEIRNEAGTVLMVTHNLKEIQSTCSRVIWLDSGRIRAAPVGSTRSSLPTRASTPDVAQGFPLKPIGVLSFVLRRHLHAVARRRADRRTYRPPNFARLTASRAPLRVIGSWSSSSAGLARALRKAGAPRSGTVAR